MHMEQLRALVHFLRRIKGDELLSNAGLQLNSSFMSDESFFFLAFQFLPQYFQIILALQFYSILKWVYAFLIVHYSGMSSPAGKILR